MTKETKINMIIDEYDDAKETLRAEYNKRFDDAQKNRKKMLELNAWAVEHENKIRNVFIKKLMSLNEEV